MKATPTRPDGPCEDPVCAKVVLDGLPDKGWPFQRIARWIAIVVLLAALGIPCVFVVVGISTDKCSNLPAAQRTKAIHDLEFFVTAIQRAESSGVPMDGTTLEALVGRFASHVEPDPWEHAYVYDGSVGFVGSWASDGAPGGTGTAEDLYCYTRPRLHVIGTRREGAVGGAGSSARFVVELSKAFRVTTASDLLTSLEVQTGGAAGGKHAGRSLAELNRGGAEWRFAGVVVHGARNEVVFACDGASSWESIGLTTGAAADFNPDVQCGLGTAVSLRCGVEELPLDGGPLDRAVYGSAVEGYLRAPASNRIGVPDPSVEGNTLLMREAPPGLGSGW